mmetsp:Transcript_36658/g.40967  ORF Transcript_36658/g.40967 Transcript_36658/m.40967 type:complete len:215 (-) Transcript_36658:34-678(-)
MSSLEEVSFLSLRASTGIFCLTKSMLLLEDPTDAAIAVAVVLILSVSSSIITSARARSRFFSFPDKRMFVLLVTTVPVFFLSFFLTLSSRRLSSSSYIFSALSLLVSNSASANKPEAPPNRRQIPPPILFVNKKLRIGFTNTHSKPICSKTDMSRDEELSARNSVRYPLNEARAIPTIAKQVYRPTRFPRSFADSVLASAWKISSFNSSGILDS